MITMAEPLPGKNKGHLLSRWILLIGIGILMFLFVAVGLPFLSQQAGFTEEHQAIIDADIHAGEWFYIFVDQVQEIVPRIDNSMKYTPGMEKALP